MKSEVERAAGAALLRDYGNFFKRQQRELCVAAGGTTGAATEGAIRAEYSAHEAVSTLELTQSDNTLLTKILGVFSALCLEVDELRREANETHFPVVAVCGQLEGDGGCGVREAAALCNAAGFAQRCQHTLSNMCTQLFHLYRSDLINMQGVQLHYILSEMSELGVLLAVLEVTVGGAGGALARRWSAAAAHLQLLQHTHRGVFTHARASALAAAARDLHARLLSDRIFQDALESLLPLRELLAEGGCSALASEFALYLKLAISNVERSVESATPDVLHKCIKVNVLFALNSHLFGTNDKKCFKALVDLNMKAHSVPLHGAHVWFPEQFLQRHAPAACAAHPKLLQTMLRCRQAYLAARRASVARDEAALQLASTRWVLSLEQLCRQSEEQLNAAQINQQAQLLLRGLQLAGEINYFVVSMVNLHRAHGTPLPRSTLLAVLRAAGALQGVGEAVRRERAAVVRAAHAVVQHLAYRAVAAILAVKKNVMSQRKLDRERLDEVTCAVVAERAARGAVTHARIVAAAVALAFLSPTAAPDIADGRLAALLHKIRTLADFTSTMSTLCDGSWLFWHADVVPVYFSQTFATKSEALQLKYTFHMLEECGIMLHRVDELLGGAARAQFADDVHRYMEDSIVKPTGQLIETDLRLHLHSHLRHDDVDPFLCDTIKRSLLVAGDFRHLQTHLSVGPGVEHYLSTVYYNLTTLVLSDRRTYSEMRQMAAFKFRLRLVEDELPTQTLEQGLDVLEIMRNIHVFVSRYLYNLNNQMFVELSSDSKHLNSITIRHVANSIRAHGTGVMNTTVNFTYQFLRNKFYTFSQFMFDEHIKSRLVKDLRSSRECVARGEPAYAFRSAERFNKGIRNLGIVEDGQSYLDLFRSLISQIGNAMGYVRMIRSGGRHCCAGATVFLPSLDETLSFRELCERDGLGDVTRAAADTLDHNVDTLISNFTGGTEYFRLLVDVFAPVFRSPKNVHLKNFFMIVPPLTLNFVENLILAKDKMTKKNKMGAAFTDDGFAMGVAYILKLLDQDGELDGLHWFESVWAHVARERAALQRQKAAGSEPLQRALALTEKKLSVLEQEFKLLYYSFSSARIFFQ